VIVTPRWLPLYLVPELLKLRDDPSLVWIKRRSGPYHGAQLSACPALDTLGLTFAHPFAFTPPVNTQRVFLLCAPEGAEIKAHVDDHMGVVVQRIVMLQPAKSGGILMVGDVPAALQAGDACAFDPNRQRHRVTRVEGCERIVLAIQYF